MRQTFLFALAFFTPQGYLVHFAMASGSHCIASPLLRLPAEIRTIIYHLLLAPEKNGIIRIRTGSISAPDYLLH